MQNLRCEIPGFRRRRAVPGRFHRPVRRDQDLFRYWLDVKNITPREKPPDIVSVHVTDYYRLEYIDGWRSFTSRKQRLRPHGG
jgi:hypothetical protein